MIADHQLYERLADLQDRALVGSGSGAGGHAVHEACHHFSGGLGIETFAQLFAVLFEQAIECSVCPADGVSEFVADRF